MAAGKRLFLLSIPIANSLVTDLVKNLYRRLLGCRRASPALSHGSIELIDAPDGVLAYRREAAGDKRVVLINFTGQPIAVPPDPAMGAVEVSTRADHEGATFTGTLSPDEAIVVRP